MEDIFEETIIDIDGDDAKNPLAVVEYVQDLFASYRKMEVSLICSVITLLVSSSHRSKFCRSTRFIAFLRRVSIVVRL